MNLNKVFNNSENDNNALMFRGKSGKLYKLTDTNLYRLFTLHADKGYIIVSACRKENDVETNNKNTQQLRRSITANGYSYKKVCGKFVEDAGTETEQEVIETSFVVYNYNYKTGTTPDFDVLYNLALKWCAEYNQDSVLVVAPNENPKCFKEDGIVDFELSKDANVEHNIDLYFTQLGNKRFKFKEIVDSEPSNLLDLHPRILSGEIMTDKDGRTHYGHRGSKYCY